MASAKRGAYICGDCSVDLFEFLRLERLKRMAKANKAEWHKVLGVDKDATDSEINKAFRRLVKVAHPDVGGTNEAMTGLSVARDEGLRVWWDD